MNSSKLKQDQSILKIQHTAALLHLVIRILLQASVIAFHWVIPWSLFPHMHVHGWLQYVYRAGLNVFDKIKF